jgi:hypothetical protein
MSGLGKIQKEVLIALFESAGWSPNSAWTWNGETETIRILDSLSQRGLVRLTVDGEIDRYRLTPAGELEARKLQRSARVYTDYNFAAKGISHEPT